MPTDVIYNRRYYDRLGRPKSQPSLDRSDAGIHLNLAISASKQRSRKKVHRRVKERTGSRGQLRHRISHVTMPGVPGRTKKEFRVSVIV